MAIWTEWKNRLDAWWDQAASQQEIVAVFGTMIVISVVGWLFSRQIADFIFVHFVK